MNPTIQESGPPRRQVSPRIATFYSYKGGVGRSMAVANIALLLARDYGLRVVAVDWDLEAPGLHRFFKLSDNDLGKGVIDFLQNYKTLVRMPKSEIQLKDLSIEPYLKEIHKFTGGGSLHLLGAGLQKNKSQYTEKVRGFNWDDFYREWNGAQVIEGLRSEFLKVADVTLVDSRTGITDVGGVCTVHLPDIVVLVFVYNSQNLTGIDDVAKALYDTENPSLRALHRNPELLFLPCRRELAELNRLSKWEVEAIERFREYCKTPKIEKNYKDVEDYLRKAAVPYVPYFAYGEELAAELRIGADMLEPLKRLIDLLLGEDSEKSRRKVQPKPAMTKRILVYGSVVAALSGILYILSRYIGLLNGFPRFELGSALRGAIGGLLGGSLSGITWLQTLPKEESWRLSLRYIDVSLFAAAGGGFIMGVIVSSLLPSTRYSLVLSVVAGFLLRPFIEGMRQSRTTFVKGQ